MISYLTIEQVIEIHDEMVTRYGGLPGIRDLNLLQSAIESPKTAIFRLEMYPSIFDKAAVYLYNIVKNHPFNDANKRTGYAVAVIFLLGNDVSLTFKNDDLEDMVIEVAKGKISREDLAYFLEHGIKPVKSSFKEKSISLIEESDRLPAKVN